MMIKNKSYIFIMIFLIICSNEYACTYIVDIRVQLISLKWLKFQGHKILTIIYRIRKNISGRITVFYLGNNGPRPTHLRGKAMILMVFFGFSVILCYILPSILIIYRIGQKFLPHNSWHCLEISVASIDFGVTMTNFAFTP